MTRKWFLFFCLQRSPSAGGNQREEARKKAEQKKKKMPGAAARKAAASGGESVQARKNRDAEIMKEKQRLAQEKEKQGN